MRLLLAALALASALTPSAPASAETPTRVAQMPRDVTDAVRKQRARQQERRRTGCQQNEGGR